MSYQVQVWDGTTPLGSPLVSGGAWSQETGALSAGDHLIKAQATDPAGNPSGITSKHVVFGSSVVPDTPDLIDDSGHSASDNLTNDNTPEFQVKVVLPKHADASEVYNGSVAAVKVFDGLSLIGTDNSPSAGSQIGSNKTFTAAVTPSAPLPDGVRNITAKWVDALGNESAASSQLAVTIDTTAPNAPLFSNINEGQVFIGTSITLSGTATD